MELSEIMTTKQVAEFLHCSTHQVGYLRKYGLLVGTSSAAFTASDVVAGGSITVNGESKVTADNFADYLCWNKHFTVTQTFTNCTWGE